MVEVCSVGAGSTVHGDVCVAACQAVNMRRNEISCRNSQIYRVTLFRQYLYTFAPRERENVEYVGANRHETWESRISWPHRHSSLNPLSGVQPIIRHQSFTQSSQLCPLPRPLRERCDDGEKDPPHASAALWGTKGEWETNGGRGKKVRPPDTSGSDDHTPFRHKRVA